MKFALQSKQGSALLIAVLVMGILITLTLGLSELVVREIRQTRDVVVAGKAYFAAEAAMENALYDLHVNLPGYETPEQGFKELELTAGDEAGFRYRYRIANTADKIPFLDPDKPVFLNPQGDALTDNISGIPTGSQVVYEDFAAATYNVLPLHGSVVIPLSSDPDGDGVSDDVQDFTVQYYFNFDTNDPNLNASIAQNLDILRWKVYGHPKTGAGYDALVTDAISDLYPAHYNSTPKTPVCIGSSQDIPQPSQDTSCYWPEWFADGQWQPWGAARECYLSDADSANQNSLLNDIQTAENGGCTIKNFIQKHTQNYLVLSNYVVPDAIGLSNLELDLGKANLYYRVIAKGGNGEPKLVREAAQISAEGFAGNGQFKQNIDASIGMSSFLPVFNFSLYRTDSSKPAIDPSKIPVKDLF